MLKSVKIAEEALPQQFCKAFQTVDWKHWADLSHLQIYV